MVRNGKTGDTCGADYAWQISVAPATHANYVLPRFPALLNSAREDFLGGVHFQIIRVHEKIQEDPRIFVTNFAILVGCGGNGEKWQNRLYLWG